jgi:hypothetical protein
VYLGKLAGVGVGGGRRWEIDGGRRWEIDGGVGGSRKKR